MKDLVLAGVCFGMCAYLLDRKPNASGWWGVAGLVYAVVWFGNL